MSFVQLRFAETAAYDVLCIGQTSIDTLETERGTWENLAGGPALYVATIGASLGLRTALVSRVGSDFDPDALKRISRLGVDIGGVRFMQGVSTRIRLVYNGPTLQQVTVSEGVNSGLQLDDIPSNYFSTKLVHLSPAPFGTVAAAAEKFRVRGIGVAFDPHADFNEIEFSRTARILKNVDLFFSNAEEARHISKQSDLNLGMKRLHDAGPTVVVVTKGEAGTVMTFDSTRMEASAVQPERLVNHIGAGDAFQAGFLAALLKGYSPKLCMLWGAASAASILGGTGLERLPTSQTIRKTLTQSGLLPEQH